MDWRQKMSRAADGVLAALLAGLLLGGVACFGGVVWWFPPVMVVLAILMVAARLARALAEGRVVLLRSPLMGLGLLGLLLGAFDLAPLPEAVARRASPEAHAIYVTGAWPRMVHDDAPEAAALAAARVRSPATLDRAATLRWLLGAAVCLAVFWSVSQFIDRVGRFYLVCGCVAAGFFLNVALGAVQLGGGAEGLWGFILPGSAPAWGPTRDDLLAPAMPAALRALPRPPGDDRAAAPMSALAAVPSSLFGTMMGGAGAVLALASLALPLALALLLHLLAPRGSRESLSERLGRSGLGGLVVLLSLMVLTGAFLVGMTAGLALCLPFAAALLVVGLPASAHAGAGAGGGGRWPALGLTALALGLLGLGGALGASWPSLFGNQPPAQPLAASAALRAWAEGLPIVRAFPAFGSGLGTFDAAHAYFRTGDGSAGFAASSLLRFLVEAGAAGAGLLLLAALWSIWRLPSCLKKVGSADRSLAYGLIGAALGFTLWSGVQATVELPAVALSASALGGAWDRWLAGGTDLFVERG